MTSIFAGGRNDKTALKALLYQAQDAYSQLATGTKAVKVSRNGRDVEFKETDMHTLRIYIGELQSALGVSEGRGRPARFNF